jgi:EAL domain-containing protein (putative c-di-GMP-specific phosphodiesterase class I)
MGNVSELKQPHDLYVGFAFAAADVLFELDADRNVVFAVGAAMSLLGRPARRLIGQPFVDQMIPISRLQLDSALAVMEAGGRARGIELLARHDNGADIRVEISGYRHPQRDDHLLVVMVHGRPRAATEHRVPQSGLLDAAGFRAVTDELVRHTPPHSPLTMTLLDLPEIARMRADQGTEAAERFVAALGTRLRLLSAGGDAAGQLADDRYGIIHDQSVSPTVIHDAVQQLAAICVPNAPPIDPKLTTLVLDLGDVPPDDIPHVLAYALNAFTRSAEAGGGAAALAAGLQPRLSATAREMRAVRDTIEGGDFDILYQPIVDLWTKVVHHFECLIRFSGNDERSPYDTVVFAEDTGLAGEIDLAVTKRVIESMHTAPLHHPMLRFAVNLSGRSLSDPKITQRLRPMLEDASPTLRDRLLFEVTESAEIRDFPAVNAVLQDMRGMGYEICLDDFGAGAAAFHYLRSLQVDHVKIDGCYIRDCLTASESTSFIRAIVNLCTELGITTIAEYVENGETANLLKLLKVRYGQGYLFGKPMRPTNTRTPWVTDRLDWRNGLLVWKG